jgi:hypothetical protein
VRLRPNWTHRSLGGWLEDSSEVLKNHAEWPTTSYRRLGVDLRGEVDMKLKIKRAAFAAATLGLAVVAFGAAVKFR